MGISPLYIESPLIRVEKLHACYEDVTVFEDVSFDVGSSEILVIAGGSGCGKSTLMKTMTGLYRPKRGRVLIDGKDIHAIRGPQLERTLSRIGVGYQGGALFGGLTVLENVSLPLREFTNLPKEMIEMVALVKLRMVGLEQAALKKPSELSGGMQKRAALARALVLDPSVVFLDEPLSGLDPITAADLDHLIMQLRDLLKTTFVIVTHELESIFLIADRVLMMDATGKSVIALSDPKTLRDLVEVSWVRSFFKREGSRGTLAESPR